MWIHFHFSIGDYIRTFLKYKFKNTLDVIKLVSDVIKYMEWWVILLNEGLHVYFTIFYTLQIEIQMFY